MHNTKQWANSDGFWWRDIHPMLREGKTRAVFSANPDGYKFKQQADGYQKTVQPIL